MINRKFLIYILILIISMGTYSALRYQPYIKLGMEVYKESKNPTLEHQEENHMMPIENPFYKYIDRDKIVETAEGTDENSELLISDETNSRENNPTNTSSKPVVSNTPLEKPLPSNNDDNYKEVIVVEEVAPTFDEIANDYYNNFKVLENKLQNDLDNLISQAVEDYTNKKYRKLRLVQVYLDKGNQLEAEADKAFSSTLFELESLLDKHSYDKSILSEIENYYTNYKKSQKKELIEKGMAIVNGN